MFAAEEVEFTIVTADVDGDQIADFIIKLDGHHHLTSADFYL